MPGHIVNIQGDFNPADPQQWEEWVGDEGRRVDTVTHGESLCTLHGFVLSHDLILPALTYWLGYSWVDYTNPSQPRLRRKCPVPHPECDFLFARRVEIRGWKYRRKLQNIPPDPNLGFGVRVPYAEYDRYLLSVDFQSVDYDVLPDDSTRWDGQPITDWDRFVSVDPVDATEIITVDGGAYTYKAAGQTFNGQPPTIHAPVLRRPVERTDLTITVRQLPYDLLFNNWNIPVKLMKAKGRVNSTPFLGQNGQTMLLLNFKPKKYPQPVKTQTWTVLQFGVDVEFNFGYQEPVKAIPSETLAGWNLLPALDPNWKEGWYGVQTALGKSIYTSVNFNNLLTHWVIDDLG